LALVAFHLDSNSGVSYYVQLMQQVRQALLFGLLKSGDQLPTVKEVVAQVALNPNTVLRAYRDLEHEGLVVSRPGVGTFVATKVPPALAQSSYRSLRTELERWIRKAHEAGLDDDTLAALVAHVLHANAEEVVA
jgi:DNA-binding transcriptional regulator YhcF (GntR family)